MTDQSRTPRVDAAVSTVTVPFEREEKILVTEAVPADFARKLELELAESQAEARRLLDRVVGLIDEREKAEARCRELEAALERISHAKADRLDHAIDIGIIDRAVNIAKAALLTAAKEPRK